MCIVSVFIPMNFLSYRCLRYVACFIETVTLTGVYREHDKDRKKRGDSQESCRTTHVSLFRKTGRLVIRTTFTCRQRKCDGFHNSSVTSTSFVTKIFTYYVLMTHFETFIVGVPLVVKTKTKNFNLRLLKVK